MAQQAAVFDVMGTLFDLTALRHRFERVGAPGQTLEVWFERALHSAASLTITQSFRPFSDIARAALESTLVQLGLDAECAEEILAGLRELPAYPDAQPALARLATADVGVAVLTNGGEDQTRELLERAGLAELVETVVTVETVEAYKPHRAPYEHVLNRLGVFGQNATLIAAHAWDCHGARVAGLETVWVDRLERRWPLPVPAAPAAAGLEEAAELVAHA